SFFTDPHTTYIYTLSLHDALPILTSRTSLTPDLIALKLKNGRSSSLAIKYARLVFPTPGGPHNIMEGIFLRLMALYNTAFSPNRSEEHTSELQSRENLVCRLLLEK